MLSNNTTRSNVPTTPQLSLRGRETAEEDGEGAGEGEGEGGGRAAFAFSFPLELGVDALDMKRIQ